MSSGEKKRANEKRKAEIHAKKVYDAKRKKKEKKVEIHAKKVYDAKRKKVVSFLCGGGSTNIQSDVCVDHLYRKIIENVGFGLFTSHPIAKSTVIGWFAGPVLEFADLKKDASDWHIKYAVHLNNKLVVVPQSTHLPINPNLDPMFLVNEPMPNTTANADVVKHPIPSQFLQGEAAKRDVPSFVCALVACSDIRAFSEITWHYGKQYDRNYDVGSSCHVQEKAGVNDFIGQDIPARAGLFMKHVSNGWRMSPRLRD